MQTFAPLLIDAWVFDAYGTLFDVHSVALIAEDLARGRGGALSQLWRSKQLEYTWLTSLMTANAPTRDADFAAITARALDFSLASLRIDLDTEARARLLNAYLDLTPFPDVVPSLARFAPRPRWILSNGTRAMLEPLVRNSGLDVHLDGILSVEDAGIFKPHPNVYQLAADRLGVPAERVGFVSSNCWDAIGAKNFGFTSFWINRSAAPVDLHGPSPDRIVATLADVPPLVANA